MARLSAPSLSTSRRVLLAVLASALFALNAWGVYSRFTSRAQIVVWDFHPPWLGLRAMLREGADPYGEAVTLSIQKQMLGQPALPGEDQFAFTYPLYVMALIGPLALLPLAVAQALWLSLLEASLLIFIFIAARAVGWQPSTWLLALTTLFSVGLYPNVWAILLGQISVVVAVLMALAWWSARTERWTLAGVSLALATIKPQMSFLFVPGLVIWAIYRRRWRLVIIFAGTLIGLLLLPLAWLPAWPLAWLAALGRYAGYTFFEPPLVLLLRSTWLAGVVAALLLSWTIGCWWRAADRRQAAFDWALAMLVVISALIAPRTSQANQLVLLLPLFFVFSRLPRVGAIVALEIGLLLGLWLIDLTLLPPTTSPQHVLWQHRLITPILPLGLALALLLLSPRPGREAAHA